MSVPSDIRVVPLEPTTEMIAAGSSELASWIAPAMHSADAYRAMLKVAPNTESLAVLEAQLIEAKKYLKTFLWATIDFENGDDSNVWMHEVNDGIEYHYMLAPEGLKSERVLVGGQIRRAMEIVGYDKLKIKPATRTIAEQLWAAEKRANEADAKIAALNELLKPVIAYVDTWHEDEPGSNIVGEAFDEDPELTLGHLRALIANSEAPPGMSETLEQPLTAGQLADALACFWNAALGAAHDRQDSTVFGVVSCMVEGVSAIATRLHESSKQPAETIARAAVMFRGEVATLPRPARHHTIMNALGTITPDDELPVCQPDEQGFITDKGRFVDRKEGCVIARAAGQIIKKHGPDDVLFSEDMW